MNTKSTTINDNEVTYYKLKEKIIICDELIEYCYKNNLSLDDGVIDESDYLLFKTLYNCFLYFSDKYINNNLAVNKDKYTDYIYSAAEEKHFSVKALCNAMNVILIIPSDRSQIAYFEKTVMLEHFNKNFEHNTIDFNRNVKLIKDTAEDAQNLYTNHALKGFKNLYSNESKKQLTESNKWFKWAKRTVLALLISILVCFVINIFTNNSSLLIYANEVTFNLVLLSIALWCARMYSINKALEINYMHKSVSADALVSYMAAIKNDDITKNTILLESSCMIFSLPETGLTSKNNRIDEKLLETIRDISPVNQVINKN